MVMIDIMHCMQNYLVTEYPSEKKAGVDTDFCKGDGVKMFRPRPPRMSTMAAVRPIFNVFGAFCQIFHGESKPQG